MESTLKNKSAATLWVWAIIPLVILIGLISIFFFTNPLALFKAEGLPPIESVTI